MLGWVRPAGRGGRGGTGEEQDSARGFWCWNNQGFIKRMESLGVMEFGVETTQLQQEDFQIYVWLKGQLAPIMEIEASSFTGVVNSVRFFKILEFPSRSGRRRAQNKKPTFKSYTSFFSEICLEFRIKTNRGTQARSCMYVRIPHPNIFFFSKKKPHALCQSPFSLLVCELSTIFASPFISSSHK